MQKLARAEIQNFKDEKRIWGKSPSEDLNFGILQNLFCDGHDWVHSRIHWEPNPISATGSSI